MLTKVLNRSELASVLKADGVLDERPDLARYVLNGASRYQCKDVTYVLAGSDAARPRAVRAAPAVSERPAITDEEAERRLDAIEARRKIAPAPVPPAPVVTETRSDEPAPTRDAGADLFSIAMRGVNDADDSIDYLFRNPGTRAAEKAAPQPDTSASAQIVELAMRGVNDGSLSVARVSRDPSGDLSRLATQNLHDFNDGPEAA